MASGRHRLATWPRGHQPFHGYKLWPVHGWIRPWMLQSKHDNILRRHFHCDLCLPPQCLAGLTALYHAPVRCYKTTEVNRLTVPRTYNYTVHGRAPCKRKAGTCPEPSIKLGQWATPVNGSPLRGCSTRMSLAKSATNGRGMSSLPKIEVKIATHGCGCCKRSWHCDPTPPPPAPVRSLGQVLPAHPPCPERRNRVGSIAQMVHC